MEIFRYKKLEIDETGINQLLRNVLDRDVRLRNDPNCVRTVFRDLALNSGSDHCGLASPWRSLTPIVRQDRKRRRGRTHNDDDMPVLLFVAQAPLDSLLLRWIQWSVGEFDLWLSRG